MKENIFKMIIMVFDICCLTLCTILNIQISIQNEQLQAGKHVERRIQQLEQENEANIAELDREYDNLADKAVKLKESMRKYLNKYDDARQEKKNGKQVYEDLKVEYDKRLYLDTVMLELDEENGSHGYVERFFKTDKKSLQETLAQTQWEDELGAKFPEAEDWGELLPVGDQIWNLYEKDSTPDSYPKGVLIQNPLIDFGYRDARAGMNLLDIKDRYPTSRKEDKRLADGKFRYLQYEDDGYRYYYVTLDHCADYTVLYVTHK